MAESDGYFTAYDDFEVHRLMLEDKPRTEAYRAALQAAGESGMLKGATVLDVGCGTGILSMMAAQAGAGKVYAVEASRMAVCAKELVKANGLEGVVEVIEARVEDIDLPGKVDIIVSEWMGFYLLHESMLDSVVQARDKWLKADGTMFPSKAEVWIAPTEASEWVSERVDSWGSMYGFDFQSVKERAQQALARRPEAGTIIQPSWWLATPQKLATLDLGRVTNEELNTLGGDYSFQAMRRGTLHCLSCWWECTFETGGESVVLSTSPTAPPTHWKQTMFFLPTYSPVTSTEAELFFRVGWKRESHTERSYNVSIDVRVEDADRSDEEGEESGPSAREQLMAALMKGMQG